MIIKRLNDDDPINISQLMNAYALLSKEGKRRVRIIFEMIFRDEDAWHQPLAGPNFGPELPPGEKAKEPVTEQPKFESED